MRDSFAKCVPVQATDRHVPLEDRRDVFSKRLVALNAHGRVRLDIAPPQGPLVITLEDVTQ